MNGIYDFEQYQPPKLDVERLMEYKLQKKKRRLIILSGLTTFLLVIATVLLLVVLAANNRDVYMMACVVLGIHIVFGTMIMGILVKKEVRKENYENCEYF